MRIIDILNQKNMSLSFEVFPPKKEPSFESVRAATGEIGKLEPSFMSVTYGAGGGGATCYTLDIARYLKEEFRVPMLVHLTCIGADKAMVRKRLADMKASGLVNIMALRGDLPPEAGADHPGNRDYAHAVDLIRDVRELAPDFCIGAACYPETHPESRNQREDILHLKEKVDAGAEFLTTQMVFDNDLFYNFLYKLREAGVTVPVLPGIMPITRASQVESALRLSGSFMPRKFKSIVDKFGSDPCAMKQAGIAYATNQIVDLYANGITNVHVYSMNKPDVAKAIRDNVSHILGKEFE